MKAEANSATSHQDSCTRLYATIITIDIVARYLKIITAERQKSPCQFSFTRFALYIVFLRHVTVAMLVFLSKGRAAMLVSRVNLPEIQLYSYANVSFFLFCFGGITCS